MNARVPIRCVLFDVGGVLVELGGIQPMLDWMRKRTDVAGLWRAWLASDAVRAFERGRVDIDTFAQRVVDEFELTVDAPTFLAGFEAWPKRPLPGAHDLLRDVRPGVIRATLSNTNAAHWPRVLNEMDFERHFDHHFASHLIDRIKPDPDAFEYVANRVGVAPSEILFVDDNAINVDAARAVGLEAHVCIGPDAVRRVLDERRLLI